MLKTFKFLAIASTIVAASSANAVAFNPIAITETYNELTHIGSYSVTNHSGDEVFAFALGNNVATDASTTYRNHWSAITLTEAEWNKGVYLGGNYINLEGGIGFNTSEVPFQNAFPGYTKANVYSMIDDTNILPGETTGYEFFYNATLPASPFLVMFNSGGVSAGQATVVPLPNALVLFATGLMGFIGYKRKA